MNKILLSLLSLLLVSLTLPSLNARHRRTPRDRAASWGLPSSALPAPRLTIATPKSVAKPHLATGSPETSCDKLTTPDTATCTPGSLAPGAPAPSQFASLISPCPQPALRTSPSDGCALPTPPAACTLARPASGFGAFDTAEEADAAVPAPASPRPRVIPPPLPHTPLAYLRYGPEPADVLSVWELDCVARQMPVALALAQRNTSYSIVTTDPETLLHNADQAIIAATQALQEADEVVTAAKPDEREEALMKRANAFQRREATLIGKVCLLNFLKNTQPFQSSPFFESYKRDLAAAERTSKILAETGYFCPEAPVNEVRTFKITFEQRRYFFTIKNTELTSLMAELAARSPERRAQYLAAIKEWRTASKSAGPDLTIAQSCDLIFLGVIFAYSRYTDYSPYFSPPKALASKVLLAIAFYGDEAHLRRETIKS